MNNSFVYQDLEKNKKRNSNFELHRIFAMLMIVAYHYAVHGVGFDSWANGVFVNRVFVSFLYAGGELGVALFFMITGYFLIEKKSASIKKVFLTTFFYAWISVLIYIFTIGVNSLLDIIHIARFLLIPVSSGNWWFVTVYVVLVLFIPQINKGISMLNRREYRIALLIAWFFLYVLGIFYGVLFAALQKAVFFYMLGGFCKLYLRNNANRFFYFIFIIIISIFTTILAYFYLLNYLEEYKSINQECSRILISGFCVPLLAFLLFRLFESLKIKFNSFINRLGTCTFGIYLLHDSFFFKAILWGWLKVRNQYLSLYCPAYAILSIAFVFIFCTLVDLVWQIFFEPRFLKLLSKILANF